MAGTIVDMEGNLIPSAEIKPATPEMNGFDGAGNSFGNQLNSWVTSSQSADGALLPTYDTGNARSEDLVRNDGYAKSGVRLHVDHIVGHQFKLAYSPNYLLLGLNRDSDEVDKFVKIVEAKFNDFANDPRCFIDSERKRTFTMIIREAVATHCKVGEITSKADFHKKKGSKYQTSIRMINYARISNPNGEFDSSTLKRGVKFNKHGAAIGYYVRKKHPNDVVFNIPTYEWVYVKREMTYGRQQFIHLFEPEGEGQTRGANNLLAALSKLKMLEKFQSTTLQNAIVNAMYAAVIESDLDSEEVFKALGSGTAVTKDNPMMKFMNTKATWHKNTNIQLAGVNIPHLLPNEKLTMQNVNAPSASLGEFEAGILRHISTSLGVSYEQLSGDFSKTNYSSARASMGESYRYFRGQREIIAKRFASMIFDLWFEEAVNLGEIKLPKGAIGGYYDFKAAWTRCNWIAAGKTNIDGLKAVKESVERITAGLSTYAKELGDDGLDYQEVFDQQAREKRELAKQGRTPIWEAAKKESSDDEEDDDEEEQPKAKTNENPEVHNNA